MPIYRVRAVSSGGKSVTVRHDAFSEEEVSTHLAGRGLTLTRVLSVAQAARSANKNWTVPRRPLINFTEKLQILYAAGVPLVESLHEIEHGVRDPRMLAIATRVRQEVEEGKNLSEALDLFPRAFPEAYRAAVRAGEQSGALEVVLQRLNAQIEWEQGIRTSVRQALIYPAFLLAAVAGLVVFLFTFLLPRLMKVFIESRVDLPGPTKVVVAISSFVQSRGLLLLALLGVLVAAFIAARRFDRGRQALDRGIMNLPLIGPLLRKLASARFIATLKTLHEAGTPILSALLLSRNAAGNACLAQDIDRVIARLEDGVPLAQAMSESRHLETLVPKMIAIGEKSGALTEALAHVVELYDREVQAGTKRLISCAEPAILLLSGCVVGFVVFATMLPLFRLFGAIKK
ncbi:MAG: type II secretion system F family protein [Planctomycetes bacterium]|nr:type II secretion system F family protein [Planctomycetota bacterium]